MKDRQANALIISSLGVFIFLFCYLFIDYIKAVQEAKFICWDVKTMTAGDYTVEFNINHQFY